MTERRAIPLPDGGTDLDPVDWNAFRRSAHEALDAMITHVATVRDRPVWQPPAETARDRFRLPLPRTGRDLDDVLSEVTDAIMPFATGNLHPRFMGWVHGAGTPVGMVAEMIAGALDMNCGGRDHIAHDVERQVSRWMAQLAGLRPDASGLFVTGSSMANFLALMVAKCAALGTASRAAGLGSEGALLTAYASVEAHGCVAQAMELAGIGSDRLRRITVDAAGRMETDVLAARIAADRAAGARPFFVVGSAGTVNTGAIDPLEEVAAIASREQLWFHVDGAIGALAMMSPELAPRFAGIERAQSIAFDFHKWGHVPYDAGFLLVSDPDIHKQAFVGRNAYLQRGSRGAAAGETWPCDLGPDLSRGFRALKTWMTIATLGADRMGAAMASNCAAARHLAQRVERSARLELAAPVALNIVCFGIRGDQDGSMAREIVMDLHEEGVAVPSWTTIGGRSVIRCAIVNHRTTLSDIEIVVDRIEDLAATRSRKA